MWWFLGYVGAYVLVGLFLSGSHFGSLVGFLITLIQLLVFFWFSSHLLKEEGLARRALLSFVVGAILASLAMISGVSDFSQELIQHSRDMVRLTAMGMY